MDIHEAQHLQDRARELQEKLGPQLDLARQNLSELNRKVTTFIRENPGTCLLGALAVGFIIGKIASRR
ncbi:MAG: hypothetical protein IRZ16_04800 [Myxococcaceae bacterium]|nr:hypothetical protein [Myxococcaceae bacterium]